MLPHSCLRLSIWFSVFMLIVELLNMYYFPFSLILLSSFFWNLFIFQFFVEIKIFGLEVFCYRGFRSPSPTFINHKNLNYSIFSLFKVEVLSLALKVEFSLSMIAKDHQFRFLDSNHKFLPKLTWHYCSYLPKVLNGGLAGIIGISSPLGLF